jgi:hypothetical protein
MELVMIDQKLSVPSTILGQEPGAAKVVFHLAGVAPTLSFAGDRAEPFMFVRESAMKV